jgi:hypothetical protein
MYELLLTTGGWELAGLSAMFEYVFQLATTDRMAGRLLSGHGANKTGMEDGALVADCCKKN